METDPDLQPIEAIYDALDREAPEQALRIAQAALRGAAEDDPVLRFLAGVALLESDEPGEAAAELRRAVGLDPDDAEFRAHLAVALFRSCEIPAAEEQARRAVEIDPRLPDAHYVLALVTERLGRDDESGRHFRSAARLDPATYPAPRRLEREAFEREVLRAGEMLPEEFRTHLDHVAVTIEELPSDEILCSEQPALDPELLGLFVGVPLSGQSSFSVGGELPPRILIFKRNLERIFPGSDQLRLEIARTLHHELGHYLGLDEDELDAIDLG